MGGVPRVDRLPGEAEAPRHAGGEREGYTSRPGWRRCRGNPSAPARVKEDGSFVEESCRRIKVKPTSERLAIDEDSDLGDLAQRGVAAHQQFISRPDPGFQKRATPGATEASISAIDLPRPLRLAMNDNNQTKRGLSGTTAAARRSRAERRPR